MVNFDHDIGKILKKESFDVISGRMTGITHFICSICSKLTRDGYSTLLFLPKEKNKSANATKIYKNEKALYNIPHINFDYVFLDVYIYDFKIRSSKKKIQKILHNLYKINFIQKKF